MFKRAIIVAVAALALLSFAGQASAAAKEQGVYVKLIEGMKADIGQTAQAAGSALKNAGFTVLATYENGVPPGCKFRAMTVVFARPDYSAKVLAGGPDKGFALPLRLGLYEDEAGVNAAMVNPVSINRTMFQGGSMDDAAEKVVAEVSAALKAMGPVTAKQIGQIRDSGEITGMGGGPFPEKVLAGATSPKPIADMAAAIEKGMTDKAGWHVIYAYKPSEAVTIVGVTNTKTEGRAFGIAGEKRSSGKNPFPGVDHAAAFPIEVVLYKKGAANSAMLLKEMWRMKLYFQDAGNWAFMKNMKMPGDIQDEIEEGLKKSLK